MTYHHLFFFFLANYTLLYFDFSPALWDLCAY